MRQGLINLDIAYYKGMFSGLKDLMQTVGADWKIADLAPSMAALDSMKGSLLGLYEKVAQNATPVSYYAWQDQGCMWKPARIRLNSTSWTLPPP